MDTPNSQLDASVWSRLKRFLMSDREVHITRQDQLTMAWMGHLLILVGVAFTLWVSFDNLTIRTSLVIFGVTEGLIVVFGILSTISTRQILGAIGNNVVNIDGPEEWMYENPDLKDRVQTDIVIAIFVIQFGSMAALLVATGGPIESPFAPMALAIGIFTPFIVNKWWTVFLTIGTTMGFYVLIILIVGDGGEKCDPQPGSYALVNLFILGLASVMTFKRRDSLSFTIRKIVRATPDRVWQAWTEKSQVEKWLTLEGDRDPEIFMDVSEGGAWRVTLYGDDEQAGVPWSGTYRELREPSRLVFTVDSRSGLGEEVITLELKKRGEHTTEMVLTQEDNGRFDGLLTGWSGFMDQIAYYVPVRRRTRPKDGPAS
jgi:uncharacterized protein YndB with AHSA1/START domain